MRVRPGEACQKQAAFSYDKGWRIDSQSSRSEVRGSYARKS